MKTIWKFPFEIQEEVTIGMPRDAQILAVQVQDGVPCLWALLFSTNPMETRRFRIYGTGYQVESYAANYVGTIQMEGESLIFHVFEDKQ